MKIVTYNVQWFKGLDNVVDIARVINVVREMADFDALCLQSLRCAKSPFRCIFIEPQAFAPS